MVPMVPKRKYGNKRAFAEIYHGIVALVGPFLPFGTKNAESQLNKKHPAPRFMATIQ